MNNRYKILIIEDEIHICNFVRTILETNGYQVIEANTGSEGSTMSLSHRPDIIILDLGLPDIDGIDLIKDLRQNMSVPIIVLSARTNQNDKVLALDNGANDYVTKPFGTEELLARVRAALRNRRQSVNNDLQKTKHSLKNLEIDYEKRKVTVDGNEVKLTHTEYDIVELLSFHAGRVLTSSEIIKKIWDFNDSGSIKKLQVNMANIRKKLGEKPGENKYILNELGVGYRMNTDN